MDVFASVDSVQFHLEDNHVVLSAVNARDFTISTKNLKKFAQAVGIPPEIDVRAPQGAVDSDLSGLSEECRDSVTGNSTTESPEPEQNMSEDTPGALQKDDDEQSPVTDEEEEGNYHSINLLSHPA